MDFVMLRNSQGIHAPLRLQMERTTAAKVSSFMDIIKKLVLFITCRKMAWLYLSIQKCLQNCSENDSLKFKSIILCF